MFLCCIITIVLFTLKTFLNIDDVQYKIHVNLLKYNDIKDGEETEEQETDALHDQLSDWPTGEPLGTELELVCTCSVLAVT